MPFFYAYYARVFNSKDTKKMTTSKTSIQQNPSSATQKSNRVLRTRPYNNSSTSNAENSGEIKSGSSERRSVHPTVVAEMHSTLKSEIVSLLGTTPCISSEDESYFKYTINVEDILFVGHFSNIYLASHQDYPDFPLIARVFEPECNIEPLKSQYLQLLKFLDRRTPWLINTWDLYFDFNGRIVIFQEYAIHGNLQEYLRTNNIFISEVQLLHWAHNLYDAMDFLGGIGICHRGIQPKHILLAPGQPADQIIAKLGSFRDAVVYYDIQNMAVINQPCRSLRKRTQGNFQAPETFGLPTEEFDPIAADVWSYGATMFFTITRTYPYNYKRPSKRIDAEIQKMLSIKGILTPGARKWFYGLLRCDTRLRTPFEQIPNDRWFKSITNSQ